MTEQTAWTLSDLRRPVAAIYGLLAVSNIGAWLWAWFMFRDHPLLLSSAALAYGFGLRHGVDADHIAAIDNSTRKLMQAGQRSLGVGFYFALGHASVVTLAVAVVALSTTSLSQHFHGIRLVGGVLGTSISALFLLVMAASNIAILIPIWRSWRQLRRGGLHAPADLDNLLNGRGALARLLRPVFKLVDHSWQLYFVGFLFGLGFDTATEIALLGMSATHASAGLPIWSIMVLPILFAAGMIFVDTSNGILMLGAYRWAFADPARKLGYNVAITLISVVTAMIIGGAEALSLLGDQLDMHGLFWELVGDLNDNLNLAGFVIIAVCAGTWLVSATLFRPRSRPLELER